ncbi:MAG: putative dehydrogenase [Candidatus Latescibacterota bacterium]|jgi:predicted dehydrogenase
MQLEYLPVLPQKMDYRIGICGAGGIVNDAHLPAYRKAGFNVECIYDKDRTRAEKTAARFGIERVCTSVEELAAAVDIVDIAVPAQENGQVVAALAAAEVALLIQKPLAEDWQTAVDTVAQIRANGTLAAVNQQMRWEPGVRACRNLLASGQLGELYDIAFHIYVDTPWHLWGWLKEKETIEVLYHSIHYLDSIRYLTGCEPISLYSSGSTRPGYDAAGETRVCTHLVFPGQLRATVLSNHHAEFGQEGQQSEFRVDATDGALVRGLGLLLDYPRGVADSLRYIRRSEGAWHRAEFEEKWFPDAFVGPMSSLMRALAGEIEKPETDVEDNLKTLRLVFAAYESMRTGQAIELQSEVH